MIIAMLASVFQTSPTTQIVAPLAPPCRYTPDNLERLKLSFRHVYQKAPKHLHIVVISEKEGWVGFTAVAWDTYVPFVGFAEVSASGDLSNCPQQQLPSAPWENPDPDWWKKGPTQK